MNIIINRPKLVRVVKLYLTKSFGNLTPKEIKKYQDSLFYVDSKNRVLMEYNKRNKVVRISDSNIWSKLEKSFNFNYAEVQLIINDWLEQAYEFRGVRPLRNVREWPEMIGIFKN